MSQSATVAAMVAVSLAITMGLVPFGPKIGSAVADLFICELGQSAGGRCAGNESQGDGTQAAGPRRVLLDDNASPADPSWYQPAYNSTVFAGPPPATVPATSGAGGTRSVNGTPTSMDWCTPPANSAVSTTGRRTARCRRPTGSTTTARTPAAWLRPTRATGRCARPGPPTAPARRRPRCRSSHPDRPTTSPRWKRTWTSRSVPTWCGGAGNSLVVRNLVDRAGLAARISDLENQLAELRPAAN